jgi:hypothetical protein
MRHEVKLETYMIEQICDSCQEGMMKPTGTALMSNPPQYQHKCDKCGHITSFFVSYPVMEYREISNAEV